MRRGVLLSLVIAISSIAPAAASAASGSASFFKATGGSFNASLHDGGLNVSNSSPAYLVFRYSASSTPDLERYAATDAFPAVGVTSGSRTDCFVDAQLAVGRADISDFTEGQTRYQGLVMSYARHFRLNTAKTAQCKSQHATGPIATTVSFTNSTAKLRVTCLIKFCDGKLAEFKPASTCRNPIRLLPGVTGCIPANTGFFKVPGGLTDALNLPLTNVSPSVMRLVLVVGGKTAVSSSLSALKRTPHAPSRPKSSSVSIACSGTTVGKAFQVASGTIAPRGRGTVVVTFTGPSGTKTVTATVSANSSGAWSASLTPTAAGSWSARAAFIGDRGRKAAVSKPCRFAVTAKLAPVT
jgi:hypothetical protein